MIQTLLALLPFTCSTFFISLSGNTFKQRSIGGCKYTPYTPGSYAPAGTKNNTPRIGSDAQLVSVGQGDQVFGL